MKKFIMLAMALAVAIPVAAYAQPPSSEGMTCYQDVSGDAQPATEGATNDLLEFCYSSTEDTTTFRYEFVRTGAAHEMQMVDASEGGRLSTIGWHQSVGNCYGEELTFETHSNADTRVATTAVSFPTWCFEGTEYIGTTTTVDIIGAAGNDSIRNESDRLSGVDLTIAAASRGTVPATTVRLAGGSRYETAVEVSQFQFPNGAGRVTLANANVQVDALPGSQLGGGPILYVPNDGDVPQIVLDEVARLNPAEVVVLGGVLAVSDGVVDQVVIQTSHPAPVE